jgi:hypothetical protein
VPKLGRPFALTADLEVNMYNYIISMLELEFGLTVSTVKKVAYQMAKSSGCEHLMNSDSDSASKWWRVGYKHKHRYSLTLRVPENVVAYRASMANREMINDVCSKLKAVVDKLQITD